MNSQLSPAEAAQALLQRRAARRSLTDFALLNGFQPAAHHRLLIEKLEGVANGSIPLLAVFMPPGSAKSTYTSILFATWVMQQRRNILAASHTTELAEKWGRRVRNLVAEHSRTLGIDLSADSQAAHRWSLADGTEYYAAGVGTGIAGFRGFYGVIDDPVRSRQDADSELIRDRTWDWYINDFRPRLVPGARQILVQTRWHESDLAGRALQHGDWDVLSLPALAEESDPLGRSPGEPLWADDAYGYGAQLLALKQDTPARTWSALYQQRPAPEEGDYFKRDWLKTATSLPPLTEMRVYGASDYAVTMDVGDYTVHIVIVRDPDGRMYILDLWRGQTDSAAWIESWCDLVLKWKPLVWAEETGQIKASVGPFLERRAQERKAYCAREAFPSRHDKAIRAQSIRGRMAMMGLYVVDNPPWFAELRSELLHFPAGKHDDQVDALGLIGQLLDMAVYGVRPKPAEKPKFTDYKPRQIRDSGNMMTL